MDQNKVVETIDAIAEKFGIAIDWTKQDILPVLNDLIHRFASYKIASNIVESVIFLIIMILGVYLVTSVQKKWKKSEHSYDDVEPKVWGWALIVISTIMMIACIMAILRAIYIPEMIFYEKVSSLMRDTM